MQDSFVLASTDDATPTATVSKRLTVVGLVAAGLAGAIAWYAALFWLVIELVKVLWSTVVG